MKIICALFTFQKGMQKTFDKKQKVIETNCSDCKQRLSVLLKAKGYTCPQCRWHQKFNAEMMNR